MEDPAGSAEIAPALVGTWVALWVHTGRGGLTLAGGFAVPSQLRVSIDGGTW